MSMDQFDRIIGQIDGLPGIDKSRPTTVTTVMPIIGSSQTYVVQTYKSEDGFMAFVQVVSAEGSVRIALPGKVTAALYRQRESLVKTSRRRVARDRWDSMDPDQQNAHVTRLRGARKPKAG